MKFTRTIATTRIPIVTLSIYSLQALYCLLSEHVQHHVPVFISDKTCT